MNGTSMTSKPKRRFPWMMVVIPFIIIIVLVGVLGVMLLPMRGVITAAQETVAAGQELGTAVKNQDLDKAKRG